MKNDAILPLRDCVGLEKMEAVMVVSGEEQTSAVVRALNDETRRRILHILRAKRMTTNEICEFLKSDGNGCPKPQTIRYHLKELERAGLITWDGLEPTGNGDSHIMTKAWRATAENVFIATPDMESLPERNLNDRTLDIVSTMRELGFVFEDENEISTVAHEFVERDRLWNKKKEDVKEILDTVSSLDPGVFSAIRKVLCIVNLNNTDFERYLDLSRNLHEKLREAFRRGQGTNPDVY